MPHFGVLNVNKPPNCTSRDVVDRVERRIRPTRAGHAGTLDPIATGVLVICVGQATRLIQYVQRLPKCYRATFILGQHSNTDDIEGSLTPIEGAPVPTGAIIDAALPQFMGDILQRPPDHSAVKIAGRRAYKLARQGRELNLAPRTVRIHRLNVLRYAYPQLEMEIECGSGTYIRSLGRDLAASLGTSAVMAALERTSIGGFRVEDAVNADDLTDESIAERLQPPLAAVADLPRIELNAAQVVEIRHGRPIETDVNAVPASAVVGAELAALDPAGQLAAILVTRHPGQLWPMYNFQPGAEPTSLSKPISLDRND